MKSSDYYKKLKSFIFLHLITSDEMHLLHKCQVFVRFS